MCGCVCGCVCLGVCGFVCMVVCVCVDKDLFIESDQRVVECNNHSQDTAVIDMSNVPSLPAAGLYGHLV